MTPEDLEAIKARADAATPGPWRVDYRGTQHDWDVNASPDNIGGYNRGMFWNRTDAEFVAHAREDVPALLAEVERLQGELANLKECYADRDKDLEFEYSERIKAEKEAERLQTALANARKENETTWQSVVDELHGEVTRLRAENNKLAFEHDLARSDKAFAEKEAARMRAALAEAEAEIERSHAAWDRENAEADQLDAEVERLREALLSILAIPHQRKGAGVTNMLLMAALAATALGIDSDTQCPCPACVVRRSGESQP